MEEKEGGEQMEGARCFVLWLPQALRLLLLLLPPLLLLLTLQLLLLLLMLIPPTLVDDFLFTFDFFWRVRFLVCDVIIKDGSAPAYCARVLVPVAPPLSDAIITSWLWLLSGLPLGTSLSASLASSKRPCSSLLSFLTSLAALATNFVRASFQMRALSALR
jgi:hypothetical protein